MASYSQGAFKLIRTGPDDLFRASVTLPNPLIEHFHPKRLAPTRRPTMFEVERLTRSQRPQDKLNEKHKGLTINVLHLFIWIFHGPCFKGNCQRQRAAPVYLQTSI
ncbi:MAG: hypothetical protein VYB61_02240 [Verrucomicrobiota bacterium]|nr:hypothetical protein [Verrucomicrobiota bacterium]